MARTVISILCLLLGLSSCAAWREDVYTMSPAVKQSARHYSDVMDDFADQALLSNVLRAKDYAPMNFNDLSSITGALSVSGTLGFTVPFGPFVGNRYPPTSSTVGTFRDTFSPSLMGSSSPVINIGTLNTQGFMMTMIQPISTTYILSKWNSYPHELLLYLFVKSIRFPDEEEAKAPATCLALDDKLCAPKRVHVNNPDSDEDFTNFRLLMSQMIAKDAVFGGDVDMRSLMLLDPLGGPVPFGQTLQATTPAPGQPQGQGAGTQPKTTGSAPAASLPVPKVPRTPTNVQSRNVPDHEPHGFPEPRDSGLPDRTYFARVTYILRNRKETLPSLEKQLRIARGHVVKLGAPAYVPSQAVKYNVYVGESSGSETLQNSEPLDLTDVWTEPANGLRSGRVPPITSGSPPLDPALPGGTEYVRISYMTSAGESLPSGEQELDVGANQILLVPSPGPIAPIPKEYDLLGYNVYVRGPTGDGSKQTPTFIEIGKSWTQPVTGLINGLLPPSAPGTQYQVSSDYNIVQTINGLSDGQLHAGNAGCPDYVKTGSRTDPNDLCPPGSTSPYVRFYKEYPAQIVLCLRTGDDGRFYGHSIAPMSDEERDARQDFTEQAYGLKARALGELEKIRGKETGEELARHETAIEKQYSDDLANLGTRGHLTESTLSEVLRSDIKTGGFVAQLDSAHIAGPAAPAAGGPPGASSSSPAGGGGAVGGSAGGGTGGAAGAMPTVTLALQPSRISAILHEESCRSDELVLQTGTEETFHDVSRRFTHIEWRSIAEVIQYLGAIARYQDRHTDHPFAWPQDSGADTNRLFTYEKGDGGRISIHYFDGEYTVPLGYKHETTRDHSLEVLSLLNELISIAKVSGSLPVPQPVQVLP